MVTKPHIETRRNTYIEGWLARHIPRHGFRPAMLTLSVFPPVVRPSRLFPAGRTPYPNRIRSGKYGSAGVAYRAGVCLAGVAGGCVGTAKTPPLWAGSVGRCSGVGVWFGLACSCFGDHGQYLYCAGVRLDSVDHWFIVAGVVGECCGGVSFRFTGFGCFGDAF